MRAPRLFWFAIALSLTSACPAQKSAMHSLPLYKQASAPIERRLDDLLLRITSEEKVRQLDMYRGAKFLMDKESDATHATLDAKFLDDKATEIFGNLGAGSIHDLYATSAQTNEIQKWIIAHNRLGIPVLFIEEGLHGFNKGTVFPTPIGLAATWDPEVVLQVGATIGSEARSTGVGMILGPVLDLAREPRWGRVEEDFGEDPYLTGQMGLAYVRGMQGSSLNTDHTLVAEPKHFAGHGSPENGSNTSPVHMGEREMRSMMLRGFEPAFLEGHAMGTMAAYHETDGVPVTADPFLLKQVLRNEWKFQGFVLSDLGAIERLYKAHHVAATPEAAACLAIRSGVDMQFYDFPHDVFQKALLGCLKDGSLSQADLNRAVRSVLRVKFALGLFDHPFVDEQLHERVDRSAENLDASLRAARESMTLLKNEGNLLPLSMDTKRIVLLGPNVDTVQYGDYANEKIGKRITLLDGVRSVAKNAEISFDSGEDISAAVSKAKSADVVILGLGEHQGISGEGFDRTNLDLPGNQEQLLEAVCATGKPVILVLQNGRPLTIGWAKEHVPVIVEAWYAGEFGGQAIAETLFGLNNPAGRLTATFPRNLGQLPDFYNADPSRGHKYVDDDGKPLFPFGWGLSYTQFSYRDLSAKQTSDGGLDATFTVTNIGEREGDEVAQVYFRQDVSNVETPERSLVSFRRLHLQAHASQTITLHIRRRQLEIWNTEKRWVVEPGNFTV